jgi:hypothetical protein
LPDRRGERLESVTDAFGVHPVITDHVSWRDSRVDPDSAAILRETWNAAGVKEPRDLVECLGDPLTQVRVSAREGMAPVGPRNFTLSSRVEPNRVGSMIHDRLLTMGDVARYLQTSERFVEEQIRLDHLDGIVIGDEWRIEPSALVDYIEACRTVTSLRSWTSPRDGADIRQFGNL